MAEGVRVPLIVPGTRPELAEKRINASFRAQLKWWYLA